MNRRAMSTVCSRLRALALPIALLAASKNPDAVAYLKFLKSENAACFFTAQGFTILK